MSQNKHISVSCSLSKKNLFLASTALAASLCAVSAQAQVAVPTAVADASNVHFTVSHSATPTWTRVYIDKDRSTTTGYTSYGVGADFLIENGQLYKYAGTKGSWAWTSVKALVTNSSPTRTALTVSRADLGSPTAISFVAQTDPPVNVSPVIQATLSTQVDSGTGGGGGGGGTLPVKYTASTATIANPERGFYRHVPCTTPLSQSQLKGYRTSSSSSMILCVFYLKDFVAKPINQATLDLFQQQMATVRSTGMKAIVRFAYSDSSSPVDAKPAMVNQHLTQLAPYLASNKDVIAVVQAGLIGSWGEWGNTQNYGDSYNMTAQNMADRKSIVDKLLSVVPAERMVQLRMPLFKTKLYTASNLSVSEAYTNTAKARLGFHNDCFLSSASDYGTYVNPSVEFPYLAAESNYVAMGGETCAVAPPRSDCPTAVAEMAKFKWSYLNLDYNTTVLNNWKNQGCFTTVDQKLGYRFVMTSGSYSGTAKPGGAFSVNLSVQNQGWAAPYNSRNVELVFRNTTTGALFFVKLAADPRRWSANQTASISETVTLPSNMPRGNYALLLNLPDPQTTLRNRPEYSIQMANSNTWEAATGFNQLNHTVGIAP
ncbi:DUF4832 domain-containing protein [Telluria beijingensis]|uniref:DUF4832 domain-containing protein n=1 Tax=Telluria beijingensis TaxID=3068633 RepID=UPI002795244A|nr:DUF4832 domain-containing protein [Massilia sp. REN29]